MFFWGLVLATEVAFVMMVRVMDALSVVVVAIAAARRCGASFEGKWIRDVIGGLLLMSHGIKLILK